MRRVTLPGRLHPDARRWLAGALLVGTGQQLFVVLRNPYLDELAFPAREITTIQGAGASAGLLAGLLGLWALRRLPARLTLSLGLLANATGYAIQALGSGAGTMLLGGAVAGLGIQFITMAVAPFLTRASSTEDRVFLFSANTLALQTLPGIIGPALGGQLQRVAERAFGSRIAGYRLALGAGAISVAAGLLATVFIRQAKVTPTPGRALLRLVEPRRGLMLLVPDALIFFGTGLTIPFLPLYFKQGFGLGAGTLGWLYATAMIAGSLAQLAAPRLARRTSTWRLLLVAQALSVPVFGVLALSSSLPAAAAASVARQALASLALPLFASFLHTSILDEDSGPIAAYRMLAQSMAWALANFLAGVLIDRDGGHFHLVMFTTMIAYGVAIAVGTVVYPRAASERAGDDARLHPR